MPAGSQKVAGFFVSTELYTLQAGGERLRTGVRILEDEPTR